jgi:hypothetical protein
MGLGQVGATVNVSPGYQEIPLTRQRTLTLKNPRTVIAMNPGTVCITGGILLVSIVFTLWPDLLEHSPIMFETRGLIHHAWHYALMLGATLTLIGEFWASRRALAVELLGVSMLTSAVAMNLAAMVTAALAAEQHIGHFEGGSTGAPSGFGMALRAGVVAMYLIRSWVLIYQPQVRVRVTDTESD